jgi:hypothetical protein
MGKGRKEFHHIKIISEEKVGEWERTSGRNTVTESPQLDSYLRIFFTKRPPLWSSGQSSWLQIGDVLWFLWGTNWIYICYVEESRPVRVPGYTTEMYCDSCEVRTQFIYVM